MFPRKLFEACQNIAARYDPDRYLISLMMPRQCRPAIWALLAFNYEIAKTREVVSDTTIGLIRLQWWRDAIAEIYAGKTPRQHEVVTPLAAIIAQYDLPKEHFDTLIYAREFDLEGLAPADLKGLYHYCDYTSKPLSELILKVAGESENERIVKTVSQDFALIGILRALPFMLARRHVMLPQDLMAAQNVDAQKICDFNKKDEIAIVVKEILECVQAEQNQFRNDNLLIKSRFLKGLKALNDIHLRQIERVDYDVFDTKLQITPPFMALRVWGRSQF